MAFLHESLDRVHRARMTTAWFAVVAASVALVWSTTVVVHGWTMQHARTPEPETLRAEASARRHVQPDRLTWAVAVSETAATCPAAGRKLALEVDAVRQVLTSHSVPATEISLTVATCEEQTDTVTQRRADGTEVDVQISKGFSATQWLELHTSAIARTLYALEALASRVDLAFALAPGNPICTYSAIDRIEAELVAEAEVRVRARAEHHASIVGRTRLGRLLTTELGSFSMQDLTTHTECELGGTAVATAKARYQLE